MSVLDRDRLESSTLSDLHAIASELSLDGYRRLRKAQLIDALIEHQNGSGRGDAETATDEDDEESTSASRRRRGRRGGRGRTAGSSSSSKSSASVDPFADDVETEEEAAARTSRTRESGRSRSSRSSRGGRDTKEGKNGKDSRDTKEARERKEAAEPEPEPEPEPVIVEGVVELVAGGSGFLRVDGPGPSDGDVYISAAQVKRCELVAGDKVSGPRRPPHRSERFPSLVRIDTVNGRPADEAAERTRFEDLACEFPTERFKLGTRDTTLKAIEPLAPFGRGSRVLITGSAWSGKSHLLKLLAGVLAKDKQLTVFAALAGVRPEELGEWADGPVQPGAAVSFAASGDAQDHAIELVVEQAKRLAARGEHALVLIDTLDGLHELTARKVMASARKLKDGGSLTVIATASEPLGGETTVIALDANLTRAADFPAVKLPETGTVRPELLVGDKGAKAIAKAIAGAGG